MKKQSIRILILEDVADDLNLLLHRLRNSEFDFEYKHTDSLEEFVDQFIVFQPHVVLSDFNLISFTGLDALERIQEIDETIPFIFVTGRVNEETAVECIKKGAWDYILKDNLYMVSSSVNNALEFVEEQKQKREALLLIKKQNEELHQKNVELKLAFDKAEESNRLKTAFIANISHEIRTPLNGILGFTALLDSNGTYSDPYKTYFDIIKKSGNELLAVMNNILNLAQIESNQVRCQKEPVLLEDVLFRLDRELRPVAEEKDLPFRIEIHNIKGFYLDTDSSLLLEILKQLVDNAIKFTEHGVIDVSCQKMESEILLKVRDTGIGIAFEKRKKIFESFWRMDDDLNKTYRGNGLGLAVVDGYLKKLGATIEVESELKKGSCFIIHHPIQKIPGFNPL